MGPCCLLGSPSNKTSYSTTLSPLSSPSWGLSHRGREQSAGSSLGGYSTHMEWGKGGGEMESACMAPLWACSQLHIWGTGFGCTVLLGPLTICWLRQKKKLNLRAWMLVNSNLLLYFCNTRNLSTKILTLKMAIIKVLATKQLPYLYSVLTTSPKKQELVSPFYRWENWNVTRLKTPS